MSVQVSAPSNIALIKYMGKTSHSSNQPTNSSLSWTIEGLRSFVQISLRTDLSQDEWAPLQGKDFADLKLSDRSRERFLSHFKSLKNKFDIKESFLIESANNFPSDCGLASSASSFAALTMAATEAFAEMNGQTKDLSLSEKAELSRLGSGSSCRSFFGPWSLWFSEGVRPVEFPIQNLLHQVLVVEQKKKAVSSSEAHRRVTSSLLFQGRPQRAEARLAELMQVFKQMGHSETDNESWKRAFEIVWAEFWDMHALFETSSPPFGYLLPNSLKALRFFEELWQSEKDGPLVTMDAGANIHLLYRPDQAQLRERIRSEFQKEIMVFQGRLT
jgi:diphosphomevalonate decarboxylase